MLKAIIIDDELNARQNIQSLLGQFCENIEVTGTADSPITGIDAIKKHNPDIVFLDIEMPHGDGFDLLKNLPGINFEVIFITAYNHYAINAFKFNAVDYIMKPVNIMELKAAVERAQERIEQKEGKQNITTLVANQSESAENKKITLPTSDGQEFIAVKNIIRCEASDYYTFFFLQGGRKILVSKSLKKFEELLTELGFYRIHQSHLVNKAYIVKYIRGKAAYFEMADGTSVPVSQRKRDVAKKITAGQ